MGNVRHTQIQRAVGKLVKVYGKQAVLDALVTTPGSLTVKKGPGAPRYFTEDVYRDIWITVQMHKAASGGTEYACCMKLRKRLVLDAKMKDVSGSTLYRQYQHAIRFMKTDGDPDHEVLVNCDVDQIPEMERRWRKELELHLLARRPSSEWEPGLAQLCGSWA